MPDVGSVSGDIQINGPAASQEPGKTGPEGEAPSMNSGGGDLASFEKENPDLYEKMMETMAWGMIREEQKAQDKQKARRKEAERQNQA